MAENGKHHLQTTPTLYDQMTSACTSNLLIYAFCYGFMHQLLSDVEYNGVPIQEVRKQVFQLEAARQAVTEDLRKRDEGVRHLAMDSARRRTGAK